MSKQFLLENISVDTVGDGVFGDGGGLSVTVWGTFGAGTITLEISDDGGSNYVPLTENGGNTLSFLAPTSRYLIRIPMTQKIRATLAGSSGASGVNVSITS